jgi:arylsulfatase A-like enzyme
MIIYSPFLSKKKLGVQNDNLAVGQDITATILEMCGVEIPSSYQGRNLLTLIEGKKTDWSQDVFIEILFTYQGYPREEGVRGKEWKYIRYFSKEKDRTMYLPEGIPGELPIYEELFNLKNDPKEQNNLAGILENAEILNMYRRRCDEHGK